MPPPSEVECPHCGCCFTPEKHTRSVPQHNRLILLCRLVFEHWHDHEAFLPKSEEHMRKWLIVQAGHFDVLRPVRVKSTTPEIAFAMLSAVLNESDAENTFMEVEGDTIVRKRAHSIAFGQLTQHEATKLFTEIDAVIEAYGLNAEKLLSEARKSA